MPSPSRLSMLEMERTPWGEQLSDVGPNSGLWPGSMRQALWALIACQRGIPCVRHQTASAKARALAVCRVPADVFRQ